MRPEGAEFVAAVRPGMSSPDAPALGSRRKPSLAGRMLRTVITLLIGVVATLAWQAYGDEAKRMVATIAPSLSPFLRIAMVKPAADVQMPAPAAGAAQSTPAAQNPAPSAAANAAVPPARLLQQQIEAMTGDLAAVRTGLDQLAAKQDQMAQNIAALQAVEQDIKQKRSSAPAQAVPIPRHKPPHVARSPAAPVSVAPSSTVPPAAEPVPPPPIEQSAAPPRPPAPLH